MKKRIQKNDILFLTVILFGLLLHISCISSFPNPDETFYFSVPLRLINGDSLIQDEWHLTQFASLFQYIPVFLWLKIKGSTEGIIVFLRVLYLIIHTVAAFSIYKFFQKYGFASVCAVAVFYTQVPYAILTISYTSVYALGLLFLSMLLFAIYNSPKKTYLICSGFCFGSCCVCNPLFVFAYPLYLLFCIFWRKKKGVKDRVFNVFIKKDKRYSNKIQNDCFSQEKYNMFFSSKAILLFSSGIGIIAAISVIYYFATGGTLSSFSDNVKMMLEYTEYFESLGAKVVEFLAVYNQLSFNLSFLLPLLFVFLIFDKKRHDLMHRLIYLICLFIVVTMYLIGTLVHIFLIKDKDIHILSVLLPLTIFSFVCFILLKNKNKPMFYCMYLPGTIGALFQFLSSRTVFATIGWACLVCALTGVFFIYDLVKELRKEFYSYDKNTDKKKIILNKSGIAVICLCFSICFVFQNSVYLQIQNYVHYYSYYQKTNNFNSAESSENVYLSTGPLDGCYASELDYKAYVNTMKDLDFIKSESDEEDPVLILSEKPWMYLYIDRPFATYTTVFQFLRFDALKQYYEVNPEKKPKYIYISENKEMRIKEAAIRQMFECKRTTLSNGVLLSVKDDVI